MAADDGIVLRVPMMDDEPPGADLFLFDPEELEQIVTAEVGGSALFASRFRECAARALLLPRQTPGKRQPLWQQRQRSAQLLDVARKYATFPIVLETVRECLQDVYDLPALKDIATARVCPGDCDGDATVTISELVTAVQLALGGSGSCSEVDGDSNGVVSIAELVAAVGAALNSCPS